MRCVFSFLAVLLLTFLLMESAHAKCGFLNFSCKNEQRQRLADRDLAGGEIRNERLASYSLNQFEFGRLQESPSIGYSVVRFSLVNPNANKFSDIAPNAKEIVDRSILDWIRSIFITKGKTFLVSIDVFEDDGESKLIAHKPIFAATSLDSFRSIIEQSDISLNGDVGFPRQSDRPHRVKLSVRFGDETSITLKNLSDVLKLASDAAAVLGGINSIVDESSIVDYNKKILEVDSILSKFESSTKMSRSVTMRHVEDEIVSFTYDFAAPNEPFDRVKLLVFLDHSESMLLLGGATEANDILNKQIHESNSVTRSLGDFITTDDASEDAVNSLHSNEPKIEQVCASIKKALRKRLVARDVAIGLNAFVQQNGALFRKAWDDNCFTPSERALIERSGIAVAKFELNKPETQPINLSLDEQLPLVQIIGSVGKADVSEDAFALSSQLVSALLDDNTKVALRDDFGFILPSGISGEFSGLQLLNAVRNSASKLDRSLGCYSGDLFDTDTQRNVLGTLSSVKDVPIEIVFEYNNAPLDRKRPQLLRLIITKPAKDRLLQYRDAEPKRAREGCAGGFKPWELVDNKVS